MAQPKRITIEQLKRLTPDELRQVEKMTEAALTKEAKAKLPPGFGFFLKPSKLFKDTHPLPPL